MTIHLQFLLQYGSKSNSLSPKPSDMQAESWWNSHSSVNSNTVTAVLPINNSRVEKSPSYSSEKLQNFRKRFKGILFLSSFLLLSFTDSQWRKLNTVKPFYDNESIINRLSKHHFSSYPPLTQFPFDNYLLYFIFLTDNCYHKLMKFKVILEK